MNATRHRALATACLGFLCVFLWKMAVIIRALQDFDQLWTPPQMADVIQAFVFGLFAFGAGLGINLRSLLVSFGLVPAWDGVEKRGAQIRAADAIVSAAVDQAATTVATQTAAAITNAVKEPYP